MKKRGTWHINKEYRCWPNIPNPLYNNQLKTTLWVVFYYINIVNNNINIFKLPIDIFNIFCYNWDNNVRAIYELPRQ